MSNETTWIEIPAGRLLEWAERLKASQPIPANLRTMAAIAPARESVDQDRGPTMTHHDSHQQKATP